MKELCDKYNKLFALDNWVIKASIDPNLNAKARTLADPRYYRAIITFKEEPDDWTVLHEFIHIVMSLYDFYMDNYVPMEKQEEAFVARENAVSQLTNIMIRNMK